MRFTEVLPIAKDVSLTLSPIVAAAIAWLGLSTWKRQARGVASYEVAKGVLLACYVLTDRIRMTRSPLLTLSEEMVRKKGQLVAEQEAYQEREERLITDFLNFKTKIQEARAMWGKEILADYDKIDTAVRHLRSQIWLHFWMKGAFAGPGATVDNNPKRVAENDRIIYYTDGSDDFSKQLDAAFNALEKHAEKRLER